MMSRRDGVDGREDEEQRQDEVPARDDEQEWLM
jgi:hypothetical protein